MNDWRAAGCLLVLKHQLDTAYPGRPKDSDGFIASAAHHAANPTSDHERHPDPFGGPDLVFAFDITTFARSPELAEDLRLLGKAGDRRVKYGIFRSRIFTARDNWAWRPYTAETQGHYVDPHDNHIHLSTINDSDVYDSDAPWPVLGLVPAHTTVPPQPLEENDMVIVYAPGKPTALFTGERLKALKSNTQKDSLTAAGIPVKHLTAAQFEDLEAIVRVTR